MIYIVIVLCIAVIVEMLFIVNLRDNVESLQTRLETHRDFKVSELNLKNTQILNLKTSLDTQIDNLRKSLTNLWAECGNKTKEIYRLLASERKRTDRIRALERYTNALNETHKVLAARLSELEKKKP